MTGDSIDCENCGNPIADTEGCWRLENGSNELGEFYPVEATPSRFDGYSLVVCQTCIGNLFGVDGDSS